MMRTRTSSTSPWTQVYIYFGLRIVGAAVVDTDLNQPQAGLCGN